MPAALAITAMMIVAAGLGLISMLQAALGAGMLMILFRCCTVSEARRSVDWSLLIAIGAAIGLGRALDDSGAAAAIARAMVSLAGENPLLVLIAVYIVTSVMTEVITNNAAAVMAFPFAHAAAQQLGVDMMPFAIVIMMAASASFATPLGYQTNLMVYGPGGYRFSDYLRIGIPMNILVGITTIAATWLIWPF
jgi:di/tricarboxylate transporter